MKRILIAAAALALAGCAGEYETTQEDVARAVVVEACDAGDTNACAAVMADAQQARMVDAQRRAAVAANNASWEAWRANQPGLVQNWQ